VTPHSLNVALDGLAPVQDDRVQLQQSRHKLDPERGLRQGARSSRRHQLSIRTEQDFTGTARDSGPKPFYTTGPAEP